MVRLASLIETEALWWIRPPPWVSRFVARGDAQEVVHVCVASLAVALPHRLPSPAQEKWQGPLDPLPAPIWPEWEGRPKPAGTLGFSLWPSLALLYFAL